MDKFIKNGDFICIRPEGESYDIHSHKIYRLLYNSNIDMGVLVKDDFELPNIIYKNDKDDEFVKKCITTYNTTNNKTTGILLSGLKGSGKTLMAKQIALMSNLPIIVVDPNASSGIVSQFFSKLHGEYCIIFDEFEKNWNTSRLLSFFDGINDDCKKLIICTCNIDKDLDDNLLDRCSRIRYYRKFDQLNYNVVKCVVSDLLNDKSKVEETIKFIFNNLNTISFDNVILFVDEINNSPQSSIEELFNDLNLIRRNDKGTKLRRNEDEDEETDSTFGL